MTTTEPNAPSIGDGTTDLDGNAHGSPQVPGQRRERAIQAAGTTTSDPSASATGTRLLESGSETYEPYPTDQADGAELANGGVAAPPRPLPIPTPTPLRRRLASGRYRSRPAGFQLELRVDVDGRHPLLKLSGDYHTISGGAVSYFGSWTVDAVTITASPGSIVIVGTARTTWQTTFTVARVTIPRVTIFQPPAPASIQWSTPSGAPGATYVCPWESAAFRTVELEQDSESGVTPFVSYDTGSLPSGGPARTLSTAGGYAEAGIQMLDTGGGNVINTPANHVWNNASLHNAMQTHFSRFAERPQFKVWLLHAMRHEFTTPTSTLLGIMFDQSGLQRQGCASFYERISSGSSADRRTQLYTHVHELGHCFNLFHAFHKSEMNPPLPNRPGSLSWMNYPRFYNPGGGAPSGEAAFWAAFPFQFDDLELAHLRHGFRNAVIMGGHPFGTGAALEAGLESRDGMVGAGGLELLISTPERLVLGTPVVLQVTLRGERGRMVHQRDQLHPKYGFVEVTLKRPNGEVIVHRPPVLHCAQPDVRVAGREEELPISAYIGYDAVHGQLFEDVGTHRIRATYTAPDGTPVASNITTLRVAAPRDNADDAVADMMLGDQAGMVLTLLGTDSEHLSAGTAALESVLDQHGEHPNALYARLALGMNAARPFLQVQLDGSTHTRPPDLARADQLLNPAVEASRGAGGLDDLTVFQVMDYLARSHEAQGDTKTARSLHRSAIQLARSKDAPASVLESLEE